MSKDDVKAIGEGARVESGPVRIGDDWAGIFIRGDGAAHYAMHIDSVLALLPDDMEFHDSMSAGIVKALGEVLMSCREPCDAVQLRRASPMSASEDVWKEVEVNGYERYRWRRTGYGVQVQQMARNGWAPVGKKFGRGFDAGMAAASPQREKGQELVDDAIRTAECLMDLFNRLDGEPDAVWGCEAEAVLFTMVEAAQIIRALVRRSSPQGEAPKQARIFFTLAELVSRQDDVDRIARALDRTKHGIMSELCAYKAGFYDTGEAADKIVQHVAWMIALHALSEDEETAVSLKGLILHPQGEEE